MIIDVLFASCTLLVPQDKPVAIERVFAKGAKANYRVESSLQIETRAGGLETFMPEEVGIAYDFGYEVIDLKADGFAVLRYKRPKTTEVRGEDFFSGPKKSKVQGLMDYELTISPINEITSMKDLSPKKKAGKNGGKDGSLRVAGNAARPMQVDIESFSGDLYRLALFVDSIGSALDFSPKLPFDEVKPGDTWQKTVGFTPQRLKGKEGKLAVQRLDYTYTYKGVVQSGTRKVHRISAALKIDTDVAEFVKQIIENPEEFPLKEIRLSLEANIDFDLDLKTRQTVKAVATSVGGIKMRTNDSPDEPVMEQKIKGRSTMSLVAPK